ncbi:Riboflavin synthase [Scedosporium apiospermum]|uniref:Riboflavin synthase n=1 Tax=Pseudallescheria apiosperma TaxID=563466 RepID=A0A084G9X9_PSEDA|nr:Riboflavin synthase [Scedosporium apiospermum]KEZ44141.1 Riboflavin synthase [Scedosporium apiospermum]
MFTGLVEEIGVVSAIEGNDETGKTMTVIIPQASVLLSDAQLGDSISTNGVCLTITSLLPSPPGFTVGVAPETLRVSNLGTLTPGSRVNLERAVRADTRMGGHFVQGHVDFVAQIVDVRADGNARTMRFKPQDKEWLKYIVHKGFIALDGTSLTITQVNDDEGWWEIMLIEYTQERVILAEKGVGESVNVEVDMMAKYAEKAMAGYLAKESEGTAAVPLLEKLVKRIVDERLQGKA